MSSSLEAQRIRNRYRRLVLLGSLKLPLEAARRLVGPDCAYHLYFRHATARAASRRNVRTRG
ncbi:MAG: hypothetical protein ACHP85_19340 [Burkholderiales bacterium]